MINNIVQSCPPGSIIAFTDGSCQPKPGPCRAGSCILLHNTDTLIELRKPVAHHGSILLGKLVAILMTLEYINSEVILDCVERIQILSDSQSAVGLLTLGWKPNQLHQTLASAKNLMRQLERKGISVIINWTPGHTAISGNEIADILAKEASDTTKGMDKLESIVTLGTIKSSARESVQAKWQRKYDATETDRRLYGFKKECGVEAVTDELLLSLDSEDSLREHRTEINRLFLESL
jgi:ribonuclease HI